MGKQDRQRSCESCGEAREVEGSSQELIFDGDRTQFFQYVRDMADHMGLCAWHLNLGIEPVVTSDNHRFSVGGTTVATCCVAHGTQNATIEFWDHWDTMRPYDLRHMVVHELVHCHTVKMLWAFNNVQSISGSTAMFSILDSAFDDMHELTVDAIAMSWAKRLPLPGEPFGTED